MIIVFCAENKAGTRIWHQYPERKCIKGRLKIAVANVPPSYAFRNFYCFRSVTVIAGIWYLFSNLGHLDSEMFVMALEFPSSPTNPPKSESKHFVVACRFRQESFFLQHQITGREDIALSLLHCNATPGYSQGDQMIQGPIEAWLPPPPSTIISGFVLQSDSITSMNSHTDCPASASHCPELTPLGT